MALKIDYAPRMAALGAFSGVDVVALVPGTNLRYFTGLGYALSERPIVAFFQPAGMSVVAPALEMPTIAKRADLAPLHLFSWTDNDGYEGAFAAALDTLGLRGRALGVDGMTMRVTELMAFQRLDPSLRAVPVEDRLIGIRARKTPDEIALLRRAVQVAETALTTLLAELRPGMTEMQIATRLGALMLEGGADSLSFPTLVQIGENADNPHGYPGSRALGEGDCLLIDYGCKVGGYPSDITRTFVYGQPSEQFRAMYAAVERANAAGRAAAGPGVPMREVDRAARAEIEAAGLGEYFNHRTGHGIGLDIHEPIPQIAGNVDMLLEPGMAFTIEPGVYLPGVGGVRIEDNVVITETGLDVLTSLPRELTVLG